VRSEVDGEATAQEVRSRQRVGNESLLKQARVVGRRHCTVGDVGPKQVLDHLRRENASAPALPREQERQQAGVTHAASQAAVTLESDPAAVREAYRGLVHEHAQFEAFFREFTPIDVIETMAMGSRPSARRGKRGIDNLRAIPWVFAWTQTRMLLPGWYGLGHGLAAVAKAEGMDALRAAAREWPFFAMLLADVEMVLAKADLDIAERYVELVAPERRALFDDIRGEFERTVALLLAVRGQDELLADDPVLARAIRLRNPYVDPMSLLQVDLLARWRQGDRQDPALQRALIASVNGIAQGLQNTG
jgi:phosphoenolpyruvate carboxylase